MRRLQGFTSMNMPFFLLPTTSLSFLRIFYLKVHLLRSRLTIACALLGIRRT